MNPIISTPFRYLLILIVSVLFVSGCSDSSDANSGESQSDTNASATNGNGMTSDGGTNSGENEIEDANTGDTNSGTQTESTDSTDESTTGSGTGTTLDSEVLSITRVDFDITVPVYSSNTLQVRLIWGDINTTATWDIDQHWTVSADFPVNTTNQLAVTFSDNNGAVTLGIHERSFTTGASQSESVQITANDFDTDIWDSDGDGVNNLNESIAGTDPLGGDTLDPAQASLELVPDKTFRITWQPASGAQFYRVLENADGISGFTNISGELDTATNTFDHRVALYSKVNAQYLVQSCNAQGCIDSDVLIVSGTLDNAIGYFKASNAESGDQFGHRISLSADGNTLAVAADREASSAVGVNADQDSNESFDAGAVYVFAREGGEWQQQAYLKSANTDRRDYFGADIDLSADGNTLVVGAAREDGDRGGAYVFIRSNGSWQQHSHLIASNAESGDIFGSSVSISADGLTVAAGAFGESSSSAGINGDELDNSFWRAGAVYVFALENDSWQQQAYVKQSNPDFISAFDEGSDTFGRHTISLSADGNTLAVGASGEDSSSAGINGTENDNSLNFAGAVYVFVRENKLWQQQAYVKASNPGLRDSFGTSVSLSADGHTLAVGAPIEGSASTGINGDQNDDSASGAGAVYIFTRDSNAWQQSDYIKASNPDANDGFGREVSLSADGKTVVVGALGEDSTATGVNGDESNASAASANNGVGAAFGAAYIFKNSSGSWQQHAYLKARNTGDGDLFGSAVSISADGNTVAVSARSEDSAATEIEGDQNDNSASDAGAVYLF